MRLAWALLPSWLVWPLIQAKAVEDGLGGDRPVSAARLHRTRRAGPPHPPHAPALSTPSRGFASAAAERGVGFDRLSLHRFDPQGPPGLVLGFACLAEPAIDRGIRLIAEAL
jgi:GntR family transcriptional regulator/MocR family aminotransferase